MKFGGSSLATSDRIRAVAAKVAAVHAETGRVVVVVSAMGKTTDELVALAGSVSGAPAPRELDVLLTAGERISIALLAIALEARGIPAVSMTGRQCGILTEGPHTRASIVEIQPERVRQALDESRVVVVAGFQGMDRNGDVTTLGRGGSDTTAVAMAAALGASTCDIYSDVDGVYSADPRLCPRARHRGAIDYDTMQELSRQGARVLHAGAVEHARRAGVTIRARATFGSPARTLIGAPRKLARRAASLDVAGADALAVTGRRDLIRIRAYDTEVAIALRAELGDRVPLLSVQAHDSGDELWAVTEELPDARAFARGLEARWPGRVDALAGLGSVAIVAPRAGERARDLLASTLQGNGIAMHAQALTPCAAVAMIDAAHVDDAVRALHCVAIESVDEELSTCAS
ncbi:MAG: aspartate kinase [Myxococcota bacterium]|nr:aspartate kinase [Myxococcota bacterium]